MEFLRTTGLLKSTPVVAMYGTMWPRNLDNIRKVRGTKNGGQGVYILFDGSMPIYVGKGNIRSRLKRHRTSKKRGQLWDRFSWYVLSDKKFMHDLEVLMLKALPSYLRALTKQEGDFCRARQVTPTKNRFADPISRRVLKKVSKKASHRKK